jgi:hypothetical protein
MLLALLAGVAFFLGSASGASAIQPPPHCDPAACIDPVDVVSRAVCYVGTQLGLHCID